MKNTMTLVLAVLIASSFSVHASTFGTSDVGNDDYGVDPDQPAYIGTGTNSGVGTFTGTGTATPTGISTGTGPNSRVDINKASQTDSGMNYNIEKIPNSGR